MIVPIFNHINGCAALAELYIITKLAVPFNKYFASTMAKLLYQTIFLNSVMGCVVAACICQKQSVTMIYTTANGHDVPVTVRKCERVLDDMIVQGSIIELPAVEPPCCCKSKWRYKVCCYITTESTSDQSNDSFNP